ncbi:MAG: sulfocyanin [Saccharolobus sp.]|uniref:Sulfocyanin n=1 Tax=Saccharolobus shibatae (strain ATCC 51178 / DSM 5389 / JCM 8931 / NBRC 15437 / B12) TaxID=523848 RepID=A0A8F5GSE5_SACSH|nr:sulfocyanin [Saccharolobus shibatae]MCH4815624.1 sulfocyanin [Saccharolobus shibatae]QXJ27661.1 Quinol oxidase-2, sulfocyanin (blue copper protein) (SoxE) [Saccharolobus shibatae B12]
MKAQSSILPVIVGILVAIIAVGVSVYAYYEYQILSAPTPTATSTSTSTSSQIPLKYDSTNKTVFLTIAVLTSGPTFNFNGTSNGQLKIYIPAGWSVYVNYINEQSLPHNLALLQNTTATPNNADVEQFGKILYIVGATISNYETAGISSGQKVSGLWGPLNAGMYMLVCGILGHAESGMWAVVIVSSNVTTPYATTS